MLAWPYVSDSAKSLCYVGLLDGAFSHKKIRKGVGMIWHAVVWSISRARNDIIFNNLACDVEEVVEEIKVMSWRWGLSRLETTACLFYE